MIYLWKLRWLLPNMAGNKWFFLTGRFKVVRPYGVSVVATRFVSGGQGNRWRLMNSASFKVPVLTSLCRTSTAKLIERISWAKPRMIQLDAFVSTAYIWGSPACKNITHNNPNYMPTINQLNLGLNPGEFSWQQVQTWTACASHEPLLYFKWCTNAQRPRTPEAP